MTLPVISLHNNLQKAKLIKLKLKEPSNHWHIQGRIQTTIVSQLPTVIGGVGFHTCLLLLRRSRGIVSTEEEKKNKERLISSEMSTYSLGTSADYSNTCHLVE